MPCDLARALRDPAQLLLERGMGMACIARCSTEAASRARAHARTRDERASRFVARTSELYRREHSAMANRSNQRFGIRAFVVPGTREKARYLGDPFRVRGATSKSAELLRSRVRGGPMSHREDLEAAARRTRGVRARGVDQRKAGLAAVCDQKRRGTCEVHARSMDGTFAIAKPWEIPRCERHRYISGTSGVRGTSAVHPRPRPEENPIVFEGTKALQGTRLVHAFVSAQTPRDSVSGSVCSTLKGSPMPGWYMPS